MGNHLELKKQMIPSHYDKINFWRRIIQKKIEK